MLKRLLLTIIGALVGAFLGAGTGIVGAFGGTPGIMLFSVIGGIIGFLGTPDILRLSERFSKKRKRD